MDMETADDEEFSPDKLSEILERSYITVVRSITSPSAPHIKRMPFDPGRGPGVVRQAYSPYPLLERAPKNRSVLYSEYMQQLCHPSDADSCVKAYFLSWHCSLLPAALISTTLVIILSPSARFALFPPAPVAAISGISGNLQVPRAGTLGSVDSLSGAPEKQAGEAVEQEATHFIAAMGAIGAGVVMGEGGVSSPRKDEGSPKGSGEAGAEGVHTSEDTMEGTLPDPSDLTMRAKAVKDAADAGGMRDPAADLARRSVEGAVWERTRPAMRVLEEFVDTWERLGKCVFSAASDVQCVMLIRRG